MPYTEYIWSFHLTKSNWLRIKLTILIFCSPNQCDVNIGPTMIFFLLSFHLHENLPQQLPEGLFHKLAPKGNILCYSIYNIMYYLSDFHLDLPICHWNCGWICFIKATVCKVVFFYLELTAVYFKICIFKTYDNKCMTYWVLFVGSTYITSNKLLQKWDLYIKLWWSLKLWSVPNLHNMPISP